MRSSPDQPGLYKHIWIGMGVEGELPWQSMCDEAGVLMMQDKYN
jgi:hypothetical protein